MVRIQVRLHTGLSTPKSIKIFNTSRDVNEGNMLSPVQPRCVKRFGKQGINRSWKVCKSILKLSSSTHNMEFSKTQSIQA